MGKFSEIIGLIPFKDIAVNAIGGFLGGLVLLWLAMGSRGIRTLRSRFQRPSVRIERRKTPENVFTGIELSAPAAWVREQLGSPTRVGDKWWGYRFTDSLLSLQFNENESVKSISVALTDPNARFEFPAWHFDCRPLGEMTLKEVLAADHLDLEFNESMRHSELLIKGREGPKGAWHYIGFGVLSPHIPGPLLDSTFEWDRDKNRLLSNPEDVKINWATVSSTYDIDCFPWDFGITVGI
uniref:hypothetical protein n=1 Tax=Polaromonas sp. TaxID=1869339 RepID=UPI001597AAC9|nr:hypothetical protein [Polaromonas sp.]QJS06393.1 hypothetical protein [Polaromonas sp.]